MANIKPLGQRVLVKRIEAETKTAGGLFLPDTAKEKPQEAEVISVGTGGRDEKGALIEFTVKPGDRVLIPSTAARKSNWTEKTTLSCLKMIFWPSSAKRHRTHTQHHFKY